MWENKDYYSKGSTVLAWFESWSLVVLLTSAIFLVIQWSVQGRELKHFPKGPPPAGLLRVLYHALHLPDMKLLPQLKSLGDEYGKVLGISSNIFRLKTVVLSDAGIVRKLFHDPAFCGRLSMFSFKLYNHDNKTRGIIINVGEHWKEIRKFCVSQLKEGGLGQKRLDPLIAFEADELVAELRKNVGKPLITRNFFSISAFNVLWQLISSQRFALNDPQATALVEAMGRVTSSWLEYSIQFLWPQLAHLYFYLFDKGNAFHDLNNKYRKFTSAFVQHRKLALEMGQQVDEDFTTAFIRKIESTTDVASPFYLQLGFENLNETIRDLFAAGTETTGTVLSWIFLLLALHPDKQEKLQREIDSVLQGKAPSLYDRSAMKYTEAVINETMRKASNVPFGVPHSTVEATTIGKYRLPKDTSVVVNAWAIHHCEEIWKDPFVFRPERFLTPDESALVKHENFIPFGVGKRVCPGATLATDELFMFTVKIFANFSVSWNPEEPKPGMETQAAVFLSPLPHTLILRKR